MGVRWEGVGDGDEEGIADQVCMLCIAYTGLGARMVDGWGDDY